MASLNYDFPFRKEKLVCCHAGPPGCYCEVGTLEKTASGNCLFADAGLANSSVHVAPCPAEKPAADTKFLTHVFKRTRYTSAFNQVEIAGYIHGNVDAADGPAVCLAASSCATGALLVTRTCADPTALTRITAQADASLTINDCPGMCVAPGSTQLSACANA